MNKFVKKKNNKFYLDFKGLLIDYYQTLLEKKDEIIDEFNTGFKGSDEEKNNRIKKIKHALEIDIPNELEIIKNNEIVFKKHFMIIRNRSLKLMRANFRVPIVEDWAKDITEPIPKELINADFEISKRFNFEKFKHIETELESYGRLKIV